LALAKIVEISAIKFQLRQARWIF